MKKKCNDCRKIKLFSDFYKRTENGQPKSICKECDKRKRKIYYRKNKNRQDKSSKKWYFKNKQKADRKSKDWSLRRDFDITIEDYENILKNQNNKCALCEKSETIKRNGKILSLAVDHDHRTGKIRGLLCFHCNTAIGKFKDDIGLLLKTISYLQE